MNQGFEGFVDPGENDWYFHLFDDAEAVKPGARPVMTYLRGRVVVMIGPTILKPLKSSTNYTAFVDADDADVHKKDIVAQALTLSASHPDDNVVFLLAAGIVGRVMGYQLWRKIGKKDTIIDVGSSLDALVGERSRDYIQSARETCKKFRHYMPVETCSDA
mmetsp:Transcript_533/g.1334  ORF Transcript_533/g.1334 Transcript_533/m.1334 type:complete len:161 (-) Transcript_533:32-514(-)